jgi:sporulation protein YlmC with PRC-barrel domain
LYAGKYAGASSSFLDFNFSQQPCIFTYIIELNMLQLSASILNRPVMSLRTGSQVATATGPIINPNNLKIEGFYCTDKLEGKQLILLYQDIRDIIPQGFVIDDHDVLAEAEELIRLEKVLELNFDLIGKQVVTTSKDKVGKVSDYAVETTTMFIQKLYASQSILKSFTGGSLSIDRTQIVEITNKKVVINDLLEGAPAAAPSVA